jgi:hypothetical protein
MTVTTTNYFGGCPTCGGCDGYLNLRRDHWMVCHACKTRWVIGANLFSSWRDETEADWERNYLLLSGYRQVKPIRPANDADMLVGPDDDPPF